MSVEPHEPAPRDAWAKQADSPPLAPATGEDPGLDVEPGTAAVPAAGRDLADAAPADGSAADEVPAGPEPVDAPPAEPAPAEPAPADAIPADAIPAPVGPAVRDAAPWDAPAPPPNAYPWPGPPSAAVPPPPPAPWGNPFAPPSGPAAYPTPQAAPTGYEQYPSHTGMSSPETPYPGFPGQPGQPGHPGWPGYPSYPGYPGYPVDAYRGWGPAPRNGFGLAAMTLGIIGLVLGATCFLAVLGAPAGIAAIVFGIIGRRVAKRGEATNAGQALSGIITGALALLLSVVMIVAIAVSMGDGGWLDGAAHGGRSPSRGGYGSRALSEGGTTLYPDGVSVTVAHVRAYQALKFADEGEAMAFTVTVRNAGRGTASLDGDYVTAYVTGDEENPLMDVSTDGGFSGDLAPGDSTSAVFVVVVPGSGDTSVEIEAAPGPDYDYAYWVVAAPAPQGSDGV